MSGQPFVALHRSSAPTAPLTIGGIQYISHAVGLPAGTSAAPGNMASGPSGSVWWTDPNSGYLGMLSSSGVASHFTAPSGQPEGITLGPDQQTMWFVETGAAMLASIPGTGGAITEYQLFANSAPNSVTVGPDGKLWITESGVGVNKLLRFDPVTHSVQQFQVPVPSGDNDLGLNDIITGPDKRLWFLESFLSPVTIGAYDPSSGKFSSYTATGPVSVNSLTVGPDRNMWFAGGRYVGRVTPAGQVSDWQVDPSSSNGQFPAGIVAGADGRLWVADGSGLDRVSPSGAVTRFTLTGGMPGSGLNGASTSGPNRDVWFGSYGSPGALIEMRLSTAVTASFQSFPTPTTPSGPEGVALGTGGDLWVTEDGADKVAKVTPAGQITEYPLPTALAHPGGIVAGPDGNMWLTEISAGKIARITPTGTVTEWMLPSGSLPVAIAKGADGNLCFVEPGIDKVGRITTAGTVTQYPVPGSLGLFDIAAGPDGDLWMTDGDVPAIYRFSPTAPTSISEFKLPAGSKPAGIAAGPDGNMWFTDFAAKKIGRILVAAPHTVNEFGTLSSGPGGIVAGPDGALWFTEPDNGDFGRATTAGSVVELSASTLGATSAIALAPDGRLWFPETFTYNVGALTPSPTLPSLTPDSGPTAGGTAVTVTGANFTPSAKVTFGSIPANSVRYISPTQLTLVAPTHTAGSVNVTVTTTAGSNAPAPSDLYAYGSPTVSSFTPAVGITGGTVTIDGVGFVPGIAVNFGARRSPSVTVLSGTKLLAVVPNGAVPAKISLSDAQGSTTSSATFTPTLSITQLSPTNGPAGTPVTIDGIGFNSSSVVRFNGVQATNVTETSSTQLDATVPPTATSGPVTVTNSANPTGTVRSPSSFTVS